VRGGQPGVEQTVDIAARDACESGCQVNALGLDFVAFFFQEH
jgi:hypothetical protein